MYVVKYVVLRLFFVILCIVSRVYDSLHVSPGTSLRMILRAPHYSLRALHLVSEPVGLSFPQKSRSSLNSGVGHLQQPSEDAAEWRANQQRWGHLDDSRQWGEDSTTEEHNEDSLCCKVDLLACTVWCWSKEEVKRSKGEVNRREIEQLRVWVRLETDFGNAMACLVVQSIETTSCVELKRRKQSLQCSTML